MGLSLYLKYFSRKIDLWSVLWGPATLSFLLKWHFCAMYGAPDRWRSHIVITFRLLQPSVIFIDSAEKTFMKKVPKTDKTDPKRLKKDLAKLVKGIGQDDQVIVIGTSRLPWECDQKLLAQAYHKMILIPRPDYASLSLLWTEQLFQYPGLSRQFNTSSVARLSDGYTGGSVLAAIKDVLTCKRVLQLRMHQLTHAEIINVLCKRDPVYREEEEEFLNWLWKTPLGRRKQRALELEAEKQKELESLQQSKKK